MTRFFNETRPLECDEYKKNTEIDFSKGGSGEVITFDSAHYSM